MELLRALFGTVLPVFLLIVLGWVARRLLWIEVKDPARLAVYLLVPGLIAHSILNATLVPAEVGKIIAFALLLTGAMILVTLLTGQLLGWSQSQASAAVLSTAFMNAANYGLPVTLLAFGQTGFERQAVFVVISSLLMYSVAVFFAARGRMDYREALLAVFRLPLVWAAGAALLVRLSGISLPAPVLKPIAMLGEGALVLMILLLGMQVASIQLKGSRTRIAVATLLRLAVSPVIGLALVAWLKPDPLTGRVLVLASAMPAAVNTTLLALQFDAEPDQVSGVTLISTLLSLVTVTFWVWYLTG